MNYGQSTYPLRTPPPEIAGHIKGLLTIGFPWEGRIKP